MNNRIIIKQHINKLKETNSSRPELIKELINYWQSKLNGMQKDYVFSGYVPEPIQVEKRKNVPTTETLIKIRKCGRYKHIYWSKNRNGWEIKLTRKNEKFKKYTTKFREAVAIRDNQLNK